MDHSHHLCWWNSTHYPESVFGKRVTKSWTKNGLKASFQFYTEAGFSCTPSATFIAIIYLYVLYIFLISLRYFIFLTSVSGNPLNVSSKDARRSGLLRVDLIFRQKSFSFLICNKWISSTKHKIQHDEFKIFREIKKLGTQKKKRKLCR